MEVQNKDSKKYFNYKTRADFLLLSHCDKEFDIKDDNEIPYK